MLSRILAKFTDENNMVTILPLLGHFSSLGISPADLHKFESKLAKDEAGQMPLHLLSATLLSETALFSTIVECLRQQVIQKVQKLFLDESLDIQSAFELLDREQKGFINVEVHFSTVRFVHLFSKPYILAIRTCPLTEIALSGPQNDRCKPGEFPFLT